MENPIKMDDLGGTTIFGNIQIGVLKREDPSGIWYQWNNHMFSR